MISEEEFAEKVAGLVAVRDALTVEEFNGSVLELASRLTVARNARNRARLFQMADEHQRRGMPRDEAEAVAVAHGRGNHCGRSLCIPCNGGRDVE